MNHENPFHWMSIQGEVVKIVDEDDVEHGHLATKNTDDGSKRYMGVDVYPVRTPAARCAAFTTSAQTA